MWFLQSWRLVTTSAYMRCYCKAALGISFFFFFLLFSVQGVKTEDSHSTYLESIHYRRQPAFVRYLRRASPWGLCVCTSVYCYGPCWLDGDCELSAFEDLHPLCELKYLGVLLSNGSSLWNWILIFHFHYATWCFFFLSMKRPWLVITHIVPSTSPHFCNRHVLPTPHITLKSLGQLHFN